MVRRERVWSWRVTWSLAVLLFLLVVSMPFTFALSYSLTYDANGNLVSGDGKYREYNNFNRLAKIYNGTNSSGVLLEEFVYHPTQERILLKKVYNASGSLVETVYYIADEFVSTTNASGRYNTTYFFANDQQVAQTLPNGTRQYLLTDIEGSAVVTTNSSGGVVERTSYAPFGGVLFGGASTRFDYEGREADNLVGDVDFRFRKYKPEWALFTQPDNIIQNVYDPQAINRYAFERNNPYKIQDRTGHVGEPVIVGIGEFLGGFVLGIGILFAPEVVIPAAIFAALLFVGPSTVNEAESATVNAGSYPGLGDGKYKNKEEFLDSELPRSGDAPFVDPKPPKRGWRKYKYDNEGNPIDDQGRSWRPDRTERHWDRQNSDGSHTRITPDGRVLSSALLSQQQDRQKTEESSKARSGGGGRHRSNTHEETLSGNTRVRITITCKKNC